VKQCRLGVVVVVDAVQQTIDADVTVIRGEWFFLLVTGVVERGPDWEGCQMTLRFKVAGVLCGVNIKATLIGVGVEHSAGYGDEGLEA
jgi:hypothetical protein